MVSPLTSPASPFPLAAASEGGGAHFDVVLLGVLAGVTVLLLLAYHSRVPYPIWLVVGGGALAFVPGLPQVD